MPTSCCFTGHRYIAPEEMNDPQAALIKVLIELIGQRRGNVPFSIMRKVRQRMIQGRGALLPLFLENPSPVGWAPAARAPRLRAVDLASPFFHSHACL